ncbi:ABC transporter substrate-binding protein [Siculibacillus lacustris]|uniref:ABC transporter substrate-binding protein n=1 Tax=Siculibacillus lacustris TaxID=1549641 RepID=A0A4Q9VLB8_9HYPH|nr:ABC transporter substrate-binding protein [Siculibacillus lacustris]TBW36280.1 ABC transporter substrate-binding protein [Siculibacillus lacustris]
MRAIGIIAAAWAASVAVAGGAEPVPAPGAPARGDVVLCMSLEPPVLDPTAGAAQAIREVTYANIFEGLVGLDRHGRIVPRLAEGWDVAADGTVFTFHLRDGAIFHDGTPVTADDVRFSFERAVAPDSKNAQKWIFAPIAAIDTPDARTVKITLKQPSANFLYGLAWGDAVIVGRATAATNATKPIGTGPYRLDSWTRGDRLTLVATGAWWGGPTRIAKATFRFVNDPQAQVAGIKAGDCDVLTNLAAPEAADSLAADPKLAVVVGRTEGETIVAMNNARKPLDDVRVRRALAMGIDRDAVNLAVESGTGTPIGSHFSPNHPAYIDLTAINAHDPDKARALLDEAGVKGLKLTLKVPPPAYARRSAEIVAAQLAEIGVEVAILPVEFPQWLEQVFRGKDYDLTIISHTEPLDIGIYARPDYYFNYVNPGFQELMATIETTPDEAARDRLYISAQKMLAQDAVNIFLFILPKITVTRGGLTGMWTDWPLPANPLAELAWP